MKQTFGSLESAADRQARRDIEVHESWANISAQQIRDKLRALEGHPMQGQLGPFLAGAIARHAPHHAGLLPPKWLPASRHCDTLSPTEPT